MTTVTTAKKGTKMFLKIQRNLKEVAMTNQQKIVRYGKGA